MLRDDDARTEERSKPAPAEKRPRSGAHPICLVTAMIAIAAMEMYAMSQGHDGVLLTFSIATIAGIAGFTAKGLLL